MSLSTYYFFWGFPGAGSDGKESAWNAGDSGSIPGSKRLPGELYGQRSLVGHGVVKSQTRLSN